MNSVYIVMIGDRPLSAAPNLATAQKNTFDRQTEYSSAAAYDYRWDEYLPGAVWRLMQRRKDVAGKGRRYSWTQYSVHTADFLSEVAR